MNKYIKRNNNNREKRIVYTSIFWENKTLLFVCRNAVEPNENWNKIVLLKTFEDVSFNRKSEFFSMECLSFIYVFKSEYDSFSHNIAIVFT